MINLTQNKITPTIEKVKGLAAITAYEKLIPSFNYEIRRDVDIGIWESILIKANFFILDDVIYDKLNTN